jgi:hypothetical protein
MNDDSQILIPDSFVALYLSPGRIKPTLPRDELAARYELCEHLSQAMVEHARAMLFGQGISEDEVLTRCHRGLVGDDPVVTAPEATWVVRRLAELLDWECPVLG